MMYDDYAAYTEKYKKEYGERTIILMEVGSFWELYDCDERKGADMKAIGDLLNIQITRKNKNIPTINKHNPLFAGFPTHALQRFLPILLENDYTIVLVSQVTPPPNPKRDVTHIISKGTNIDDVKSSNSNYIMSIFLEQTKDIRKVDYSISIGISVLDLTTGEANVFEVTSQENDKYFAFDEVVRIVLTYRPSEVVLLGDELDFMSSKNIIKYLGLEKTYVHDQIGRYDKEIHSIDYQKHILNKVYGTKTGLLTPIEYIDMETNYYALTSFISLVRFAFKHNEVSISKLQKPCYLDPQSLVSLSYNTVEQLDIEGLVKMLNKCITGMGKRYFRQRLLNPYNDANKIKESYSQIDYYTKNKEEVTKVIEKLKCIYDVERLFRKLILSKLHPYELYQIFTSLESFYDLSKVNKESISNILGFIRDNFKINICEKYNIDDIGENIFVTTNDQNINSVLQNISIIQNELSNLLTTLNDKNQYFKMEKNDKDGYYLVITTKRLNELQNNLLLQSLDISSISTKSFTLKDMKHNVMQSNYTKLTINQLRRAYDEEENLTKKLQQLCKAKFITLITTISSMFQDEFQNIVKEIQNLDYHICCARIAKQYNYCMPTLHVNTTNKSFVNAQQLRHPIIERIIDGTEYIPNDISLGDSYSGMLLYGLNAAGKSSLMKAVGLNIIMAQAGMFVPCSNFSFSPYNKIFTRINHGDNLYKGQSTFMIEMSELRNILNRCDENSLVIGDELCAGTESISATAIVSAGIITLTKRKSSFIFTTHLHDLMNVKRLNDIPELKVFHLDVFYDQENKKLIYNRKLLPGSGSSVYGLEVCRALDMPRDFIELANEVRREHCDQDEQVKRSRYNKSIIVDVCSVCGSKASDVHHIKHQAHADENGFHGHVHKNNKNNLVTLCEECHNKTHNGNLRIDGYIKTSDGIELKHEFIQDENNNNSNELKDKIDELRFKQKKTIKQIALELHLSEYKVNKIIKSILSKN